MARVLVTLRNTWFHRFNVTAQVHVDMSNREQVDRIAADISERIRKQQAHRGRHSHGSLATRFFGAKTCTEESLGGRTVAPRTGEGGDVGLLVSRARLRGL